MLYEVITYLAYALIDAIVDSYFLILESIGDRIELLEEQLISDPGQDTLHAIHNFKREMILLRKSVWPLREVISGLQRDETELITVITSYSIHYTKLYDRRANGRASNSRAPTGGSKWCLPPRARETAYPCRLC